VKEKEMARGKRPIRQGNRVKGKGKGQLDRGKEKRKDNQAG
jgi:hypothetical protein